MRHSNFFKFKRKNISDVFKGWNSSCVLKLNLKKKTTKEYKDFLKIENNLKRKEKLIIVKKGKINIKLKNRSYEMSDLDTLNIFSNFKDIKLTTHSDSELYLICCLSTDKISKKPILFNFKKDIKPKNLWGGRCISRVYYGNKLNVVMFDLKKGFKFHDNGHKNEQITWLINGEMMFYANTKKKLLKTDEGISIWKNHAHGGLSNGAIGFDAFFPKRRENRYKK